MRYIKPILYIISIMLISGCAELSSINKKVGSLIGDLNGVINSDKQIFSEQVSSKRDIDTLYVRIKRNIGFKTMEEMLKCDPELEQQCKWQKASIVQGGYVHEKTPGVYYRMADTFGKTGTYYIDVTIEKEEKTSIVHWKVKGSQGFANEVKAEILKSIK